MFDYNGTIAIDGVLIPGVREALRSLAGRAGIHVITADTFGFVTLQVSGIDCEVVIIPPGARHKASWISSRNSGCSTPCSWAMGQRSADAQHAAIGIAVLQEEGLATAALSAADLVVKDILDVFALLKTPERIMATLRT